jgi:transposase-like protein
MRKHPRSYPPEFRRKIIELARSGAASTSLLANSASHRKRYATGANNMSSMPAYEATV